MTPAERENFEAHMKSHVSSMLAITLATMSGRPDLAGMILSALEGTWAAACNQHKDKVCEPAHPKIPEKGGAVAAVLPNGAVAQTVYDAYEAGVAEGQRTRP